MVETKDITDYLEKKYNYKKTYAELACNPKIKSGEIAFDYDAIKETIAGNKCTSADALCIKKNINFIEFKTGFANEKSDANAKTHKENLALRMRLKAYESLCMFEKIILSDIGDNQLKNKVNKRYIAVVDSNENPMDVYADILKNCSGNDTNRSKVYRNIFENSLLLYRKTVKGEKCLFYDVVEVWYDFEFDKKVQMLN